MPISCYIETYCAFVKLICLTFKAQEIMYLYSWSMINKSTFLQCFLKLDESSRVLHIEEPWNYTCRYYLQKVLMKIITKTKRLR